MERLADIAARRGLRRLSGEPAENPITFYAPGGSGNTLGTWAVSYALGAYSWQPSKIKAIRGALLATHSLFNGRGRSQSLLGWDFIRTDMGQIQYNWYQANGDYAINVSPAGNRTTLPRFFWSVANSPKAYPIGVDEARERMVVNGVNYQAAISNPVNPSLITPANPFGTTSGGGNYVLTKIFNKGLHGVN